MSGHRKEQGDLGFAMGLLTGACFGAGLVIWLVPRLASELRERLTDSARSLGEAAGDLAASRPRTP
jgi:hypothetical protein